MRRKSPTPLAAICGIVALIALAACTQPTATDSSTTPASPGTPGTGSDPNSKTITFNSRNGKQETATQAIEVGKTAKLRKNSFANSGYVFMGWADSKTGTKKYDDEADYAMGNADVSLYAVWSAAISFFANGGSGSMQSQLPTADDETNNSLQLTSNGFTAPDGKTFAGWMDSMTSPAVYYKDGGTIIPLPSQPLSLYAIWMPSTVYSLWGQDSNNQDILIVNGGDETALTGSLTLPLGVSAITQGAFGQCTSLSEVTIPATVKTIGDNAFNGCTALTTVTVQAPTPPELGATVFSSSPAIKVPAASLEAYKAADGWMDYSASIVGY